MNPPLISSDHTLALWAIITGGAALSILLEQKYKWAATASGAIIALILAMILSNIGVIPTSAPAYDTVWNYVVPLAIPLLLMKCDIKKIGKESGKLLVLFLMGSAGTIIGAFFFLFSISKTYSRAIWYFCHDNRLLHWRYCQFSSSFQNFSSFRYNGICHNRCRQCFNGALFFCTDFYPVHSLFLQTF